MTERPEQPPEGRLLAAATERSGLSIREAARRAGISYGRWRQIATGVQHVSPGNYAAVHAPAKTLAKMARVVGVTPEQLEAEGRRPDAAESLREMERQPPVAPVPAAPVPAPAASEEDDLAEVRVLLAGLDRAKIAARSEFDRIMTIVREFPPGVVIPGAFLFDDPRYQAKWDETLGREYGPGRIYSPARTALVVAVQQFRDQRRAAERDSGQGGVAAGLIRAP